MIKKTFVHRLLHFPLTKIIAGLLVLAAAAFLSQAGTDKLLGQSSLSPDLKKLLKAFILALLSLLFYSLLYRFYEKRRINELSGRRLLTHLLMGTALGAILQSLTILVMWLGGAYHIEDFQPFYFLVAPLAMAFSSAIFEELLVRGVIYRILEEKLGSYMALCISALIFGALHLGNPNSTWLMALGLAIQAGVLLAVAFIYSKNLWFPIAIHFAWNFTQAGIYGASVSGNASSKALVKAEFSGPDWLSGGAFGPEGSVQATVFCLLAAIILLRRSQQQGKIVPPFWKRQSL